MVQRLVMWVQRLLILFTAENMASFEVDMILSEVPVGDTVELTVQYNPSG